MDLVLQFREYDDKEPDADTFKWELSDVDTVEKNLIKAIELATYQTLVTKPPGWLFSRIAGILCTDYEIPNPGLSAREAKPTKMWPKGGIQKRSARSKVFNCMPPLPAWPLRRISQANITVRCEGYLARQRGYR